MLLPGLVLALELLSEQEATLGDGSFAERRPDVHPDLHELLQSLARTFWLIVR